ncbi:ABC transporter ATP-binding protein [Microvirga sp. 2YAF29]|uniref:ABC transporter ATP-binding protein n=1 Tax=Microvirga sp. 2YAF29 TaxID=3233031 RepID=UPI003F9BFD6A
MTNEPQRPEGIALWRGVEVRYPFAKDSAVGPVDLSIGRGERVLLLGPSGSGKSTLLLTLTGLIPASIPAEVCGEVTLFGEDVSTRKPWHWAAQVAQYFQDADQTLTGMRVEDEIAFALESRALPPIEITETITQAMRRVGLPDAWRARRSSTLSGGEKQLVALAATLVQDAELFVADEPTAHLAPEAADRLHALLSNKAFDRSILIVDHRLEGLIEFIDRVVVLGRSGSIIAQGCPREMFRRHRDDLANHGIWRPAASVLDADLYAAGLASPTPPLSIPEALDHLDPHTIAKARPVVEAFVGAYAPRIAQASAQAPVVVKLAGAECAPFLGPIVLRGVDLTMRQGEVLGILGANGAGKSTLGLCLAGLLPLRAGRREGKPGGYAFQRPENQFTEGSVAEEIASIFPKHWSEAERRARIAEILAAWGLDGFGNRHPFELSQGQKRRLALATLTASDRWPLLVLDEPLAGLDARGADKLTRTIEMLQAQGRTIAIITHDMDFAMRLCPRSIVVGEGGILADGPTQHLIEDASLLQRAGLKEPVHMQAVRWLRRNSSC